MSFWQYSTQIYDDLRISMNILMFVLMLVQENMISWLLFFELCISYTSLMDLSSLHIVYVCMWVLYSICLVAFSAYHSFEFKTRNWKAFNLKAQNPQTNQPNSHSTVILWPYLSKAMFDNIFCSFRNRVLLIDLTRFLEGTSISCHAVIVNVMSDEQNKYVVETINWNKTHSSIVNAWTTYAFCDYDIGRHPSISFEFKNTK